MVKLSKGIVDVIVCEYGQGELLRRLADPFWFQAFSCAIGFDWNSSGTTTTTCGALKLAISPERHGIAVAGGKGKVSRKAPEEIERCGELLSLPSQKIESLKYSSRMSAKVDECCVQDFYSLYSHSFIFTEKGEWCTVQQGMRGSYARRYHWLSDRLGSFVEEPHSGICGDRVEKNVLDLTAKQSEETRKGSLDLVRDNPVKLKRYTGQMLLTDFEAGRLTLPARHEILTIDISERGWDFLRKAYELQPESYEELVSLKGIGAKTLRALALVSDLVYGSEASWKDPVKYSFCVGGKDGIPFPVDREVYDSTIEILRGAVEEAKIGRSERYRALRRLSQFAGE